MTVPASAELFTGKPAPSQASCVARGLLAEPYPLAQANAGRTLATQAALGANAAGAVTQTGQATFPTPSVWTANDSYPWLALV